MPDVVTRGQRKSSGKQRVFLTHNSGEMECLHTRKRLAHQEYGVNTRKRLAHQEKVCTPGRGSQDGEQQERKLTSQAEEKTERV